MKNCIYKKGKDICTSPIVPNCPFFKKRECTYHETENILRSYRLESHKVKSERRMEDYT